MNREMYSSAGGFSIIGGDVFRPATEEQKLHLETCIKKKKYIPLEKIMNSLTYNIY